MCCSARPTQRDSGSNGNRSVRSTAHTHRARPDYKTAAGRGAQQHPLSRADPPSSERSHRTLCLLLFFCVVCAAGDSSHAKDPLIVSMLLANFLCAVYTNVLNIIIETAETGESAVDNETSDGSEAAQRREEQVESLLHDPLRSFDTGVGGPLLFFKRDASCPAVFLVLFLRREMIDGSSSADTAGAEAHAADAECAEWMRSLGVELAERLLHSFLDAYGTELGGSAGAKSATASPSTGAEPPRKSGAIPSTKHFRPWLKTAESLYTSSDFAHAVLDRIVDRIALRFQPRWIYILHARNLMRNMEEAAREKHGASAALRAQGNAPGVAAGAPAGRSSAPPPPPHKRRASNGVADASSIVAQPAAFVPRPPAHPSPAAMAASASASAAASPSSGEPVVPANAPSSSVGGRFFPSTRPLSLRPGTRFPFAPPPRRRWWHFGRGAAEQPELFWRDVGRTTCFYAPAPKPEPRDTADAAVDATQERGPRGEEESKQQPPQPPQQQAFASSFAPLLSPMPSPSPSPVASSPGATAAAVTPGAPASAAVAAAGAVDPSLPSPVALHKLVSLLYHAGQVLSGPSEVADALSSMEITLALPQAATPPMSKASNRPLILSGHPAPFIANARTKLMVLRVAGMIIAVPSTVEQQTAMQPLAVQQSPSTPPGLIQLPPPGAPSCLSLPALLSAVRPVLRCVETHFACVASIHERADKAMRKEMEKRNAGKQNGK